MWLGLCKTCCTLTLEGSIRKALPVGSSTSTLPQPRSCNKKSWPSMRDHSFQTGQAPVSSGKIKPRNRNLEQSRAASGMTGWRKLTDFDDFNRSNYCCQSRMSRQSHAAAKLIMMIYSMEKFLVCWQSFPGRWHWDHWYSHAIRSKRKVPFGGGRHPAVPIWKAFVAFTGYQGLTDYLEITWNLLTSHACASNGLYKRAQTFNEPFKPRCQWSSVSCLPSVGERGKGIAKVDGFLIVNNPLSLAQSINQCCSWQTCCKLKANERLKKWNSCTNLNPIHAHNCLQCCRCIAKICKGSFTNAPNHLKPKSGSLAKSSLLWPFCSPAQSSSSGEGCFAARLLHLPPRKFQSTDAKVLSKAPLSSLATLIASGFTNLFSAPPHLGLTSLVPPADAPDAETLPSPPASFWLPEDTNLSHIALRHQSANTEVSAWLFLDAPLISHLFTDLLFDPGIKVVQVSGLKKSSTLAASFFCSYLDEWFSLFVEVLLFLRA